MEAISYEAAKDKLRDSQQQALDKLEEYLKSDSQQQALITMPTGTGKTAVMALLSQMLLKDKSILYITTSGSIRTQLYNEVSSDFWQKLKIGHNTKKCKKLLPSDDGLNDEATDYFMTIQGLIQLSSNERSFNNLKDRIHLILFDEGHKEPATVYAKLIRSFEKKMIIFTATPQRNDNNQFDIDERYRYHFKIKDAIVKGVVEHAEFKNSESTLSSLELLDKVIEYMNSRPEKTKCIIKCNDYEEIKKIVKHLTDSEKVVNTSILGIHHAVKKSDGELYRENVPDKLTDRKERYLVHQNKLTEGIDDNNIKTLVLMDENINVRELVQQVGRIIRKTGEQKDGKDERVVFSKGGNSEQQWNNFLEYDSSLLDRGSNKKKLLINKDKYMKAIIEQYQEYIYSSRKSLKRIDFAEYKDKIIKLEDIENSFKVKLKMNIFEKINQEYDEEFFDEVMSNIIDDNTYILCEYKDGNQLILIYVHFKTSELLINDFFLDHKLEIFILNMYDNYIFVNDSRKTNVLNFTNNYKSIDSELMNRILIEDSILKGYTVKNSVFINSSYRSMSVSGENLENLSKDRNNKMKVLNRISASVKADDGMKKTLYLGYKKGRISEGTRYETLKKYFEWAKSVHTEISNEKSTKLTSSFAQETTVKDTELIYIGLELDLEEIENKLYDSVMHLEQLEFQVEKNMFNWNFEEHDYLIELKYDTKNTRYKFIYDGEVELVLNMQILLEYFTDTQSFNGILKDVNYRYMSGRFFKIGYDIKDTINPKIIDEIKVERTERITEKGESFNKNSTRRINQEWKDKWSENSLFGYIESYAEELGDSKLKDILELSELIICVDLRNEIADFIAISKTENQVSFIHCKAGNSKLSASAFHDICGQITKNIAYYSSSNQQVPEIFNSGSKQWKLETQMVDKSRIIKNELKYSELEIFGEKKEGEIQSSESDFWSFIKEIQSRPDSQTNVIAFVGDLFTYEDYKNEKKVMEKERKIQPQIIALEHLINATHMNLLENNINFLISSIPKNQSTKKRPV